MWIVSNGSFSIQNKLQTDLLCRCWSFLYQYLGKLKIREFFLFIKIKVLVLKNQERGKKNEEILEVEEWNKRD